MSLFNEIAQTFLNKIEEYIDINNSNALPWENIFGNNLRLVEPLKSGMEFIFKIKDTISEDQYDFDWEKWVGFKISDTDKKNPTKIGKILANRKKELEKKLKEIESPTEPKTNLEYGRPKYSAFYIKNQIEKLNDLLKVSNLQKQVNTTTKESFYIVYSRSPVDVIRMADFDEMDSCHSCDRGLFSHAMADSIGLGGVCYLITEKDYDKLIELGGTSVFDESEIFDDPERSINKYGVVPVSRLRLRLVEDSNRNQLCVPIVSIYGKEQYKFNDMFKEQVLEWAKKQDVSNFNFDDKLVLRGGSYEDIKVDSVIKNLWKKDILYSTNNDEMIFDGVKDTGAIIEDIIDILDESVDDDVLNSLIGKRSERHKLKEVGISTIDINYETNSLIVEYLPNYYFFRMLKKNNIKIDDRVNKLLNNNNIIFQENFGAFVFKYYFRPLRDYVPQTIINATHWDKHDYIESVKDDLRYKLKDDLEDYEADLKPLALKKLLNKKIFELLGIDYRIDFEDYLKQGYYNSILTGGSGYDMVFFTGKRQKIEYPSYIYDEFKIKIPKFNYIEERLDSGKSKLRLNNSDDINQFKAIYDIIINHIYDKLKSEYGEFLHDFLKRSSILKLQLFSKFKFKNEHYLKSYSILNGVEIFSQDSREKFDDDFFSILFDENEESSMLLSNYIMDLDSKELENVNNFFLDVKDKKFIKKLDIDELKSKVNKKMNKEINESQKLGIFNEIAQKYIDRLKQEIDITDINRLPWKHIFGNNLRIVEPLQDGMEFIVKIKDYSKDVSGLDQYDFDWEKWVGFKISDTDKKNPTKIGKILANRKKELEREIKSLSEDMEMPDRDTKYKVNINYRITLLQNRVKNIEELLKVSNLQKQVENTTKGSFYIVYSRAPIDVIRMSDFDGMGSCHSADGGEFQNAIAESAAQGGVVYLITEKDYNELLSYGDDIFNQPEIFDDDERGINDYGIIPISRQRLRLVLDKSGNQLCVPKNKIYGGESSKYNNKFKEQIMEWAKKQDVSNFNFDDELILMGGRYEDPGYKISDLIWKIWKKDITYRYGGCYSNFYDINEEDQFEQEALEQVYDKMNGEHSKIEDLLFGSYDYADPNIINFNIDFREDVVTFGYKFTEELKYTLREKIQTDSPSSSYFGKHGGNWKFSKNYNSMLFSVSINPIVQYFEYWGGGDYKFEESEYIDSIVSDVSNAIGLKTSLDHYESKIRGAIVKASLNEYLFDALGVPKNGIDVELYESGNDISHTIDNIDLMDFKVLIPSFPFVEKRNDDRSMAGYSSLFYFFSLEKEDHAERFRNIYDDVLEYFYSKVEEEYDSELVRFLKKNNIIRLSLNTKSDLFFGTQGKAYIKSYNNFLRIADRDIKVQKSFEDFDDDFFTILFDWENNYLENLLDQSKSVVSNFEDFVSNLEDEQFIELLDEDQIKAFIKNQYIKRTPQMEFNFEESVDRLLNRNYEVKF